VTPEEVVRARIVALPAVTALVGARVYLDKIPQHPTYPLIRVVEIDDPYAYHIRGPLNHGRARVQVDLLANEASGVDPYAALVALEEAVRGDGLGPSASGLSGWIGTIGDLQVLGCFADNRRRGYTPDELHVVMMHLDYIVRYAMAA
jgi:Protein of unknown function (DUF3168)